MRFALCNELFQDWPWEEALQLTCQYGYTGWEIAPFTLGEAPVELSAARRQQLRQQVAQAGVEVVGLHWLLAKTQGYHLTAQDASVRARTSAYLADLARLCRDLGGDIMVLGSPQQRNFPPEMSHRQAEENACSVLDQVIPALQEADVILALEPLGPGEGNFWNHASQAAAVIEKLQSPHIKLHLDVKAMSTEGRPIDEVIRDNARHMVHFHANDPNLLGPGMGDVDFVPIFRALRDVNYSGWVSVEVFDYAPGVETIVRESMQNMRAALGASPAAS